MGLPPLRNMLGLINSSVVARLVERGPFAIPAGTEAWPHVDRLFSMSAASPIPSQTRAQHSTASSSQSRSQQRDGANAPSTRPSSSHKRHKRARPVRPPIALTQDQICDSEQHFTKQVEDYSKFTSPLAKLKTTHEKSSIVCRCRTPGCSFRFSARNLFRTGDHGERIELQGVQVREASCSADPWSGLSLACCSRLMILSIISGSCAAQRCLQGERYEKPSWNVVCEYCSPVERFGKWPDRKSGQSVGGTAGLVRTSSAPCQQEQSPRESPKVFGPRAL